MGPRMARARSSVSTLPISRPLSAQSVQSNDSNATQLLPPTGQPMPSQLISSHHRHTMVSPTWSEGMSFANQPHVPNGMGINGLEAQLMGFAQAGPLPFAQANFTYNRVQSPAISSIEGDAATTVNGDGEMEAPKKKGSATSQANDMELRRLYRENEGRSLQEVAQEVRNEEKGPKSEKSKQVFGMLWLSKNIQKSTESVPRNRVYTSYATRCADDHLPLLNPASFGKLVRIIFPNIATRRLGVRGESKYHYVNLSLVNETSSVSNPPSANMAAKADTARPRTLSLQPRTAESVSKPAFPVIDTSAKVARQSASFTHKRTSSIFLQDTNEPAGVTLPSKRARTMARTYSWPAADEAAPTAPLELPSIEPYLPPGTDFDAAKNLQAVYLSHCRLSIDKFRFCHTDAFCETFKSLVGLLTVPSQKLMSSRQLAAWIEACDTLKYQRMAPLLRQILLAKLPPIALNHMEKVANNLCNWILQYFGNQPQHLIDAMIRPARAFCKLTLRFMRVNRSAQNMEGIFEDQQTRDDLWFDWVAGSDAVSIVEDACDPVLGGHHRLLYMLFQETRLILQPSKQALEQIKGTSFDEEYWAGLQPAGAVAFQAREEQLEKSMGRAQLIERLQRFIEDIPSRYPGVEAEEILSYVSRIIGTATRNLTLNQKARSLSHWWSISLFISEMMYWMAEVGGFLAHEPLVSTPTDNYLSPYESLSGVAYGPGQKSGSGVNKQYAKDTSVTQSKLARLESALSASSGTMATDGQPSTQKSRVSLGGETVVGDDDDYSQLGGNIDWTMDIKDPGIFAHAMQLSDTQSMGISH